jgi:hypothetical protein
MAIPTRLILTSMDQQKTSTRVKSTWLKRMCNQQTWQQNCCECTIAWATHLLQKIQEMAKQGALSRRLANCPVLTCTACLYGKAGKKPWRGKQTKSKDTSDRGSMSSDRRKGKHSPHQQKKGKRPQNNRNGNAENGANDGAEDGHGREPPEGTGEEPTEQQHGQQERE